MYPHEKVLGIHLVSNPSTGNQRISTLAYSMVAQIGKYISSDLMIQINQTGVYGVEIPPPSSLASWADIILIYAYPPKKLFGGGLSLSSTPTHSLFLSLSISLSFSFALFFFSCVLSLSHSFFDILSHTLSLSFSLSFPLLLSLLFLVCPLFLILSIYAGLRSEYNVRSNRRC